ncbi:MAG: hypothetical protein V4692_14015, partial [Bdellovibrionota bacterium]
LAFADIFVVFLPTDGILISSSMLRPKKWLTLAFAITIGSTLASIALAIIVQRQGLPWVIETYPGIDQSQAWIWADSFFEKYGLLLVFAIGASPFFQQPSVILAALANTPVLHIGLALFTGRLMKYLVFSYVASHTPRLLSKLWGMKSELEEVGIKANSTDD